MAKLVPGTPDPPRPPKPPPNPPLPPPPPPPRGAGEIVWPLSRSVSPVAAPVPLTDTVTVTSVGRKDWTTNVLLSYANKLTWAGAAVKCDFRAFHSYPGRPALLQGQARV